MLGEQLLFSSDLDSTLQVFMQAIVSVLQQKSACQDDDTIDEDDQQVIAFIH